MAGRREGAPLRGLVAWIPSKRWSFVAPMGEGAEIPEAHLGCSYRAVSPSSFHLLSSAWLAVHGSSSARLTRSAKISISAA